MLSRTCKSDDTGATMKKYSIQRHRENVPDFQRSDLRWGYVFENFLCKK